MKNKLETDIYLFLFSLGEFVRIELKLLGIYTYRHVEMETSILGLCICLHILGYEQE